jgi:hypothetical protein
VDSDWERDVDRRRSNNGYLFQLFGGAISWTGKQKVVVTLSTAEAKYMVATHACKGVNWLMKLCSGVGIRHRAITI